jgi:outer membrane lipoprotein SlyB
MPVTRRNRIAKLLSTAVLAAATLAAAGCATGPDRGGYGSTYGPPPPRQTGARRACPADRCGVVREVTQVYIRDDRQSNALGTVIGAVVGGVLGNTIGKGDGRKAATVVGAVAGGAVGHEVSKRNSGDVPAWRVVVRLDDGRMATVTQRDDPGVRRGDYVRIEQGHVYPH